MKLRNKKTGEIGYTGLAVSGMLPIYNGSGRNEEISEYSSLAELSAEWEDYEEPKDSVLDLMILILVTQIKYIEEQPDVEKVDLEDCKQLLEKLKAFKRLRNKGFRFCGVTESSLGMDCVRFEIGEDFYEEQSTRDSGLNKDLRLLFGGEE